MGAEREGEGSGEGEEQNSVRSVKISDRELVSVRASGCEYGLGGSHGWGQSPAPPLVPTF